MNFKNKINKIKGYILIKGGKIYDPFFTTKEAGEGTGLGLSLVFSIVEDLNGDIDIISPIDKPKGTGTQVILRFPCYHEGDSQSISSREQEAEAQ